MIKDRVPTESKLILDKTFEIPVSGDIWHLKKSERLEIAYAFPYEGIVEFSIPELKIESYADLRGSSPETLKTAVRDQLSFEISEYILACDIDLTENALKLKDKLLEKFEKESPYGSN